MVAKNRADPFTIKLNEKDRLFMAIQYKLRRQKLVEPLPDQSVVIMDGARRVKRSRDQMFPFWQFGDFFYMSGWDEPDAILVVTKNNNKINSILFHTGYDEFEADGMAPRVTHEEAKASYQFDEALPLADFDHWLTDHAKKFEQVYSIDASRDYTGLSSHNIHDTTRLNQRAHTHACNQRDRRDRADPKSLSNDCKSPH